MKQRIAFALLMGLISTGTVSFTLIAVLRGFAEDFTAIWLKSWIIAYLVATPVIMLVAPKVQVLVNYLFGGKSTIK